MPVRASFEAYQDMIARKACLDRLTGSQWCANMDTYLALARKIGSAEAYMADVVNAAVLFVERVESAQRDLTTTANNYGILRQAVELFVEEMEAPLQVSNEYGEPTEEMPG